MKNIYVLPTDKPSIICKLDNVLVLSKIGTLTNDTKSLIRQNIYITNDEEIKDGDWCLSKTNEVVRFGKKFTASLYKKIILTTDQDLIKDGVQSIDDEFLEWFVKNPSCEEVEVVSAKTIPALQLTGNGHCWWKIIIPKEEPKQGTLEEVAENESEYLADYDDKEMYQKGFIDGAKWQQERSYSEEEFLEFSEWVSHNDWVYLPSKGYWVNEEEESEEIFTTKELLKQFKNK